MTDPELEQLLSDCPKLYHMAEHGSWPSIREKGLLSTAALLDLYEVRDERRIKIETQRRAHGIELEHQTLPRVVIRDQIPMTDSALRRCLQDNLEPSDWYRLLNARVFFWLSRARLLRLLGARAYRDKMHDIIELDARSLVRDFFGKISLSPINSGSTIMRPSPRGLATFLPIVEYQYAYWRERGRGKTERVVELAVDYSVPNIAEYVMRVVEMRGNEEIRVLNV